MVMAVLPAARVLLAARRRRPALARKAARTRDVGLVIIVAHDL